MEKQIWNKRYGTNFYGEVLKVNEMLLVRIVVYSMGVLRHFGTWRNDIVQKSSGPKFVDSSFKQYIIWEYPDILALKIIHEDLI